MFRLVVLFLGLVLGASSVLAQDLHIIGTGSVVGLYYPVGGAVSFIVNNEVPDLLLTVKVTPGSVANVEALSEGDLSLALVQSDVMSEAYQGHNAFSDRPIAKLRALMGLHAEPLHLVCRQDSGVKRLRDVVGKRINLGPEGSGILNTARAVLAAYKISESQIMASYEAAKQTPELLIEGQLDCFFFTIGIGGAAIQTTALRLPISLIPIDGPELMPLLSTEPYYSFVTVPAHTYPGVDEAVTLFGVKAFLVTTTDLPEETAYQIVTSLIESFNTLKETYPLLETLIKEDVLDGLSIPLHPGAERAYRELGLL
ncbi:MAG: TAXI family TRAP transporter solute-binding subunit [Trueperaceae bacterium]|nr:TAXI family TRAP transporter solute-binding subunit [Trueperaceae bacterium]